MSNGICSTYDIGYFYVNIIVCRCCNPLILLELRVSGHAVQRTYEIIGRAGAYQPFNFLIKPLRKDRFSSFSCEAALRKVSTSPLPDMALIAFDTSL